MLVAQNTIIGVICVLNKTLVVCPSTKQLLRLAHVLDNGIKKNYSDARLGSYSLYVFNNKNIIL